MSEPVPPADARTTWRPSGPMIGLLTLLVLFLLLLAWRERLGDFFSLSNLQVLLHHKSYYAVAALGMLLVIISGGIDLSVGSVMALVTVVTMQTYRLVYGGPESAFPDSVVAWLGERSLLWSGTRSSLWASLAAVSVGLASGTLCGVCNGLVITRLRLSPFVATLGMMSIAKGLAVWLSGRTRVSFSGPRPAWVDAILRTSSDTLVFDPGVWSAVGLAVVVGLVLTYTVFGRHCYAIGSSEATARLCGIDIDRSKVLIYGLSGLFAGWAGILLFAQISGGDSGAATSLELEVIAAVVIGGASLAGGQGTVTGTMMGVLILGVLENGVNTAGVPIEVKFILIGGIVIVNTALSAWQRRRSE